MGEKESDQTIINSNLRLFFNPMKRQVIGSKETHPVVALNTGNSPEHELKKCEIAFDCMKQGRTIITEGQLKNNKRPDIVVLDLKIPLVYEIVHSEKAESIIKKSREYMGLEIIVVRTE